MKLTSVKNVQDIMKRHNLKFNKGYGQNFLINDAIPKRIAAECGADENSGILEIGPGIGTLTHELCTTYQKVVAVEIDKNLIPVLEETMSGFQNLKIINADILKINIAELIRTEFGDMRVTVCANLPYYITTPIIMSLLESEIKFDNITVMIQKEVALRLCAKPGQTEYGAITASVMRYGTVTKLFNVSAGNFLPAPKVDSAVIRIAIYKVPIYLVKSEKIMSRCIRGAFAQRRKTLVNSLSSEFHELRKVKLTEILESCGYSGGMRGEQLGTSDFAVISNQIYDYITESEI